MARLLGIDYGEKFVGVAISDESNRTANPLTTLVNDNTFLERLLSLIREHTIETIVLGESTQLSGVANPIQTRIDALSSVLREKGYRIDTISEHWSSQQVRRAYDDTTKRVDAEAAALLLNFYIEKTMNSMMNSGNSETPQNNQESEEKKTEEKISIDQFKTIEMKVGKILAAEIVPDADKLLKLTVDVGEEAPRQIVSGIREYFPEPEMLVGVVCPFVTNLAPRMLRKLESNGMILAAHDEAGNFSLLRVDEAIAPGTKLS